MDLIYWWLLIAWIVASAVVVAVVVRLRRRDARSSDSLPVANSERLTTLPSYRAAIRRYRRLLAGLLVAAFLLLATAAGLSARPSLTSVTSPDLNNRDIVLCLDVSGSMIDYDRPLLATFSALSAKFTGERISLVLFNASAVTYFPLTSDYAYIQKQFDTLEREMASGSKAYYSGTLLGDRGSSLIGDGLASCTQKFDSPSSPRSRSIILATDNQLAGQPIFTLPEAGQLAKTGKIRVYGINPGDTAAKSYLAPLAEQYRTVVKDTGGGYFALDDPKAIPSIVSAITSQQAAVLRGAPQLTHTDQPALLYTVALLALAALFVLAWRVRR